MPDYTPGRFIWHELFTPDMEKSKGWYAELFGWKYQSMPMAQGEYTMVYAGERGIGGFMSLDMLPKGVPPHWLGYVSADPDAVAKATGANGGTVVKEPFDIPGPGGEVMGRMAVIQDPTGSVVATFRGSKGDEPEREMPDPSTFCWDQLNTVDPAKAKAFYAAVLGWNSRPFGAPGIDVFVREGEKDAASLMQAPPGAPSHWLSYVFVPKLADSRARVQRLGGKVWLEHQAVPGVGAISVVADAAGATLGLFEPES